MKLLIKNRKLKIPSDALSAFTRYLKVLRSHAHEVLPMKSGILHAQQGISLLLMVTMVGGLFFVTSAAVNLIWTVSKSSRTIGESEQAYFAALAAVEQALYEYEKGSGALENMQIPKPPAINPPALQGNAAATFTANSVVDYLVPTYTNALTASNNQNLPIDTSNNLNIDVPAGKTFFLNLSTQGVTYPSQIQATLVTGSNITAKSFAQSIQAIQPLNTAGQNHQMNIPLSNNDAKLLITNSSGATARVQIKPTGGNLPLGIIVTGVGRFKNTERKVEVAKPNWVIY